MNSLRKGEPEKTVTSDKDKRGIMLVVSAPSGTGKTTLCRKLLSLLPNLHFSISYTTRPPRVREVDGRDYHFVSHEEFTRREREGEFLEREEVFGNLYGTSRRDIMDILEKGDDILLDIDTKGAKSLKSACGNEAVFIFILPPSLQTLKERLTGRGSENEASIARRLERAADEIDDNYWYDYIVFNDKIESSVSIVESIYVAEKHKRIRQLDKVAAVIGTEGGK